MMIMIMMMIMMMTIVLMKTCGDQRRRVMGGWEGGRGTLLSAPLTALLFILRYQCGTMYNGVDVQCTLP